jgi:hypothetical protein
VGRKRTTTEQPRKSQAPVSRVTVARARLAHNELSLISQYCRTDRRHFSFVAARPKITERMQLSLKTGSPFVFINDSRGARVQEGIDSLAGYASVFSISTWIKCSQPLATCPARCPCRLPQSCPKSAARTKNYSVSPAATSESMAGSGAGYRTWPHIEGWPAPRSE